MRLRLAWCLDLDKDRIPRNEREWEVVCTVQRSSVEGHFGRVLVPHLRTDTGERAREGRQENKMVWTWCLQTGACKHTTALGAGP